MSEAVEVPLKEKLFAYTDENMCGRCGSVLMVRRQQDNGVMYLRCGTCRKKVDSGTVEAWYAKSH